MRSSYWSNSVFADKLRKLFGLPKQPVAATADGWDEYHKLEQSISPFRVSVVESLDSIQKAIYWPTDSIKAVAYYCSNVINGTHVLKTRTKFGQWGDLTSKIPDALMLSVVDYVEKECFWMNVAFMSKQPEDMTDSVWKYKNQNYLTRKLFPTEINRSDRMYHGLQYIEFQIENSDEKSITNYREIIAAYNFAKYRYFNFDAYEESGYNRLHKEPGFMNITDEQRECFKVIDVLETKFDEEVTLHCGNIVKHRHYLWT